MQVNNSCICIPLQTQVSLVCSAQVYIVLTVSELGIKPILCFSVSDGFFKNDFSPNPWQSRLSVNKKLTETLATPSSPGEQAAVQSALFLRKLANFWKTHFNHSGTPASAEEKKLKCPVDV